MDNYAKHMFSDAAKTAQAEAGTLSEYNAVYQTRFTEGLGEAEKAYVESRTSCYIASITEGGYPYIQHRGGPAGFLHVKDAQTLAFADYRGNKQFITQGNLQTNNKVSLILVDYPRKARLKLIGQAVMVPATDDPVLAASLVQEGQGPVERLVTIKITAMDWNCPQYITPRFTEAEIEAMFGPQMRANLRKIDVLANRLIELGEDPAALLQNTDFSE